MVIMELLGMPLQDRDEFLKFTSAWALVNVLRAVIALPATWPPAVAVFALVSPTTPPVTGVPATWAVSVAALAAVVTGLGPTRKLTAVTLPAKPGSTRNVCALTPA